MNGHYFNAAPYIELSPIDGELILMNRHI